MDNELEIKKLKKDGVRNTRSVTWRALCSTRHKFDHCGFLQNLINFNYGKTLILRLSDTWFLLCD